MPGNVLEIPGGGATLPDVVPTRETWLRTLGRAAGGAVFFDPRLRVPQSGSAGSGTGCCPCPQGQDPYRYPQQGPNPNRMPQNPSLGQPDRPVKPFQPMMPDDPCQPVREALNKIGTTPEELKRAMAPGSPCGPKRKAKRKKAKAKTRVKAKRRATSRVKAKKKRRSTLPPFYEPDIQTKREMAAARKKGLPGVARGKLRLLSNGACFDPRTNRFVKKSRCA